MTVAIGSEQPSRRLFTGAGGKMDAAAFCIANAIYDSLFVSSSDGLSWLPNLATVATPNATYTKWLITLRQGVKFHDGTDFNADDVIANYTAAKNNATVGLAIQPLIKGVTKKSDYSVEYETMFPWTTFPFQLAEQQIGYMAQGSKLRTTKLDDDHPAGEILGDGKAVGTGPFKLAAFSDWDWSPAGNGDVITLAKNTNYWKKDHTGASLPYLSELVFKVIVDPTARTLALRGGQVDIMSQADGTNIKAIRNDAGSLQYRTDEDDAREPAVNCIIMNTQQGETGIPAGSKTPKTGSTNANAKGCVNGTSKDDWNPNGTAVIADYTIRKACAQAINRATYFSVIDGSVGTVLDGAYRKTVSGKANPLYKDPKYPAYKPSDAVKAVNAWKAKNPGKTCGFYIDTVQGSTAQDEAFAWIQGALSAVGITVTQRKLTQPDLIAMKIAKTYDASTWSQFGGVTPDLNYVWWNSSPFGAKGQLPNFVNFAQQSDPKLNKAMQTAMKATTVAARKAGWQLVNTLLVGNMPYLFLDATVTMWAARAGVRNFTFAESAPATSTTSVNGTTTVTSGLPKDKTKVSSRIFTPDGGSCKWEFLYWN
jgi:ABC-type transport system substrate-binding protein